MYVVIVSLLFIDYFHNFITDYILKFVFLNKEFIINNMFIKLIILNLYSIIYLLLNKIINILIFEK